MNYPTPLFDRLQINPETFCLEAYLENESDPRVEVPADNKTLESLIKLLMGFSETIRKDTVLSEELADFLFEGDLALQKEAVLRAFTKLRLMQVEELILHAVEIEEDIIIDVVVGKNGRDFLENYEDPTLIRYFTDRFKAYIDTYNKSNPEAELGLSVNLGFEGNAITQYSVRSREQVTTSILSKEVK